MLSALELTLRRSAGFLRQECLLLVVVVGAADLSVAFGTETSRMTMPLLTGPVYVSEDHPRNQPVQAKEVPLKAPFQWWA